MFRFSIQSIQETRPSPLTFLQWAMAAYQRFKLATRLNSNRVKRNREQTFLNPPSLIKSCTISWFPCNAARCREVFSSTVRARISAPCSKNSSHSSRLPREQAKWNGVIPLLSGQLTDDRLLLSRSVEVSTHPWRAAKWSGVAPSASFKDGSALYSISVLTASKLL